MYNKNRYDVHVIAKRQQPQRGQMSVKAHQLVLNERRGNAHITGKAVAASKTSLYTGTAKELHLQCTSNMDIQRPAIPHFGTCEKNTAGLKYLA